MSDQTSVATQDIDESDLPTFWVKAGNDLAPGQIAVIEEDAAHPGGIARIIKGDPKANAGEVGATALVNLKLARRELVRIPASEIKRHQSAIAAFEASEQQRVAAERQAAAEARAAFVPFSPVIEEPVFNDTAIKDAQKSADAADTRAAKAEDAAKTADKRAGDAEKASADLRKELDDLKATVAKLAKDK